VSLEYELLNVQVPFPLNIVLFPFSVTEWWLQWMVLS
jgi:hypothetical protein